MFLLTLVELSFSKISARVALRDAQIIGLTGASLFERISVKGIARSQTIDSDRCLGTYFFENFILRRDVGLVEEKFSMPKEDAIRRRACRAFFMRFAILNNVINVIRLYV